jgi:glycosyltransferase involved in cell wall biosynthesis
MDRQVPSERIIVTPNGVNPRQLVSDSGSISDIRRQQRIGSDTVVIGFVGSLRRWHGIEFLAQAIPRIVAKHPCCLFLIVGTGELEGELLRLIQENNLIDSVRFTGGVPYQEVPHYIAAIDIGLMPDSNEWGSPMKILEYMLQGKAVVAPKLGPIEEILQNGHTGILFERLNLDAFVWAISDLVQSAEHRESIGRNAQDYVLSERTWTANAEKVVRTIKP